MKQIDDGVLNILSSCKVEEDIIYLPPTQLERVVYKQVNDVLEGIGGKWNRKRRGHVFQDGNAEELLESVLLSGSMINLKKDFQFFPTPRPLAQVMCSFALITSETNVLEPEVGRGDLADVIWEQEPQSLLGIELNRNMEACLKEKPYETIVGQDFLKMKLEPRYDRVVMNPPFARLQDIDHIYHAYGMLKPGGRLVAIVSESAFFRSDKKAVDFRSFMEQRQATNTVLESGTFKESGTMVRSRILVMEKDCSFGEIYA
ncbi:class I SAM-dependent methyltransferase (plasmid) [Enterocloster clostridioformis]